MTWRQTARRLLLIGTVLAALSGCGRGGPSPDGSLPPTVATKSGIDMVLIPAGSFDMGGSHADEERPVHRVSVDSFLMDKFEVTQAAFEKIGPEADPPLSNVSHFRGPDLPVEQVTWPQAVRFCNARSQAEGLKPCYREDGDGKLVCDFEANGYRLPTEAEWEYACRAGSTTDYSFGGDARLLGDHAWFADNANGKTHPVGQKKPNAWGLYDMHGNVAEWCQDIYSDAYYAESPDKNPHGPEHADNYVLRGGSWKWAADAARSPARRGEPAGFSDACLARDAIGFRCVRKPSPDGD